MENADTCFPTFLDGGGHLPSGDHWIYRGVCWGNFCEIPFSLIKMERHMGRNPLLLCLTLPTTIMAHSYFLGGGTGLPWWLRWERICLQCRRPGFNLRFRKIPWRREWLPTPVFLPGEFHEQRSLVGYSPWGLQRVRDCIRIWYLEWSQSYCSYAGSHGTQEVAERNLPVRVWIFDVIESLTLRYFTSAAAAAKSLQSCPTLCDPIDGSPPGPAVPGIFQARVLEWGAIAFSD